MSYIKSELPDELYFKVRLDANAAKINALISSLDDVQKKKYKDALKANQILTSDNMSKYTKEGDKIDLNTRVNWVEEFDGIEINKLFVFKKLVYIDRETILKELGLVA